MQLTITALLWLGALGGGLLAGVYFAFSAFVMTAFGRIEPAQGIKAMNSINATILHSAFMPLFLGTTLSSLVLLALGCVRWGKPGSLAMVAGSVIFLAGMFACTMLFNVPLNNELAAVDPQTDEGVAVWARYLKNWTMLNHVRTASSTVAAALYFVAMLARAV